MHRGSRIKILMKLNNLDSSNQTTLVDLFASNESGKIESEYENLVNDSLSLKKSPKPRLVSETAINETSVSNAEANGLGTDALETLDYCLRASYILIGSGAAAYAAVQEILRHDSRADILILSKDYETSYLRSLLSEEFQSEDNLEKSISFESGDSEEDHRK